MDSANTGSLQSSSGGDEEYNSRASVPQPFMPLPNQSHQPFDPFQNYLQSPLLNHNWSAPTLLRSDPNPNTNIFSSFLENNNNNLSRSQQQVQNQPAGPRNPKKRTRASRRAPTTVMTTDTSNFRAMVQEFTGIPAPPFNNNINSHFSKTSRLDLFGTRSPTSFDILQRSFHQKLPNQTFLGYHSAANNDQSLVNSVSCTSTNSAAGNYSPAANLFNIQNPLINSLLQTHPTFPLSNSSNFLANNTSKAEHHQNQGSLPSFGNVESSNDPFGLGHGTHDNVCLTGLPNLISSDQMRQKDENNEYSGNNNGINYGFSTREEEKKVENEAEEDESSKKVC